MDAELRELGPARAQSSGAADDLCRQQSATLSGYDVSGGEQGNDRDAISMPTATSDPVTEPAHAGRLQLCQLWQMASLNVK